MQCLDRAYVFIMDALGILVYEVSKVTRDYLKTE